MRTKTTLLLLCLLLSACGIHLRGSEGNFAAMSSAHVQAAEPFAPLASLFARALQNNNVALLTSSKDAQYTIYLDREIFQRRTVAIGNDSLAAQYEVSISTAFRVEDPEGKILIPTTVAQVRRSYDVDPNATVAKQEEERLIERELRSNLVQQILRRVRYVHRAHSQASATES